ncbi:MAG: DHHA1 domain-containing protein, partial [Proteobacteria bacterium]|nr:DHHA1 domain-containing protein [Pseudomonadota bacterium]
PPRELKTMVDDLKGGGAGVYAIVGVNGDKASLVVGVTDGLIDRFDAVALTRLGVAELGGKGGGGRPDMAQAGGPDGAKGQAALDAIAAALGG